MSHRGSRGPGDSIIVTKGPAIEAAGIFAAMFPDRLEKKFGAAFARKAEKIFWKMSVVEDALAVVSVGVRDKGVTAMHDATECGLWGGLYEMAQAGGFGVRVIKEAIPMMDVRQGDLRPVWHRPVQVNQRGHAHRDVPAEEDRGRAGRAAAKEYSVRCGRRGDPQGHDARRGRQGEEARTSGGGPVLGGVLRSPQRTKRWKWMKSMNDE